MFVILVYDAEAKRVTKFLKNSRQFLTHIQNSVFEGEITEGQLKTLKGRLKKIMDPEYDSVVIYKLSTRKIIERENMGIKKPDSDEFII